MEKVTIQEASRRLNLSQADIRESIRNGDLKATREPSPSGRRWMVEMPEEGWEHHFTSSLRNLAKDMTPWWWSNAQNTGFVHYVQDLGIEEIEPLYLCGLKGTTSGMRRATPRSSVARNASPSLGNATSPTPDPSRPRTACSTGGLIPPLPIISALLPSSPPRPSFPRQSATDYQTAGIHPPQV